MYEHTRSTFSLTLVHKKLNTIILMGFEVFAMVQLRIPFSWDDTA
jgi:hypothetical protein